MLFSGAGGAYMEKQVGEERNRQKRQSKAVKEEGKEQNSPPHSLFAGQKSIELNICQHSLSVPPPAPRPHSPGLFTVSLAPLRNPFPLP